MPALIKIIGRDSGRFCVLTNHNLIKKQIKQRKFISLLFSFNYCSFKIAIALKTVKAIIPTVSVVSRIFRSFIEFSNRVIVFISLLKSIILFSAR